MIDLFQFITSNSLPLTVGIIIIFLCYQFFLAPLFKKTKDKPDDKKQEEIKKPEENKTDKKESNVKRISGGFGVMMDKVKNSNYVKSVQEENEKGNPAFDLPSEFTNKKRNKKSSDDDDQFSTDLSGFGKVNL